MFRRSTPPQLVMGPGTQVTGQMGLAPWQQIGVTLIPGVENFVPEQSMKFTPYQIMDFGHQQPYTPVANKTGNAPLRAAAAPSPYGPFSPYPQVQNAAIVSQASLTPAGIAAAQAAAANGLQGGVF